MNRSTCCRRNIIIVALVSIKTRSEKCWKGHRKLKGKDSIENAMMIVKFIYMMALARENRWEKIAVSLGWTGKHPFRCFHHGIVVDDGNILRLSRHWHAPAMAMTQWFGERSERVLDAVDSDTPFSRLVSVSWKLRIVVVDSRNFSALRNSE